MGFKQGWAMLSLSTFAKWNFNKAGVVAFGFITFFAALLILFPQTFTVGNFVMGVSILLMICLQISIRELKGAAIEIPFLLLTLLLIYLQYPLSRFR